MASNHYEHINHILITGGTGLVGRYLTSLFLSEGYRVSHLSRKQDQFGKVRVHRWDPEKGILDPSAIDGVDYVIHLAGASLGTARWTKRRKEKIVISRVEGANLIHKVISENKIRLKGFISASGTNYYGTVTSERVFSETDRPGNDFAADVCRQWEEAAGRFESSGIRTVKLRTGIVLERYEGALPRIMFSSRFGILGIPRKGRHYMPCIHINDLCGIYLKAIREDGFSGVFNAVSPQNITFRELMMTAAEALDRKTIRIDVPALVLKLLYGEMSSIVLEGSRVSSEKLLNTGFRFQFPDPKEAIRDVLGTNH